LVFARGAKAEHPSLRFRDVIAVYRVVALSALFAGRDWDGWGCDAFDGGYARTSRVLSHREDIGGAVVQPILFFPERG
jgi:hypothetical protein